MSEENELLSEETLKALTAAVFLGFLISDAILIEDGNVGLLAIIIPFQVVMIAIHRKRLKGMFKYLYEIGIQPYQLLFKAIYKMFTGRDYEQKPTVIPKKPIDPKVNGKWEIPVKLTPEYEAKLNRYMKYYELDYEPEIKEKVKQNEKPKIKPAPQKPKRKKYVVNGIEINSLDEVSNVMRQGYNDGGMTTSSFHGVTVANHLNSNFVGPETNQTLNSNNSKIVVDGAEVKGNNNRITGNRNVIKGNNLRVKGDGNIVKGNNVYVDGKNNQVKGNNATVINRGGCTLKGNNGKMKDF